MEKRKWLWKRKSSERSPGETESSGSMSSPSERYSDDQDASKGSPNHNSQSPEVTSKEAIVKEEINDSVKILTEKLSAALVNVSAKEDLVKQHAKVAEEAVAGWEKAEAEVAVLKQQLEAALKQNLALEDRTSHLDGALKECVRQLRQGREEQEQKIQEVIREKSREWESTKAGLESQLLEFQAQAEAAKAQPTATVDPELYNKLESLEKENSALKYELLSQSEELELRIIERDLSAQAAETASKQHLESIKKVAKLEAECRRLQAVVRKSSLANDQKSIVASSTYVESLTDSQSDSGERLNALDIDSRKMSRVVQTVSEPSCSGSWASALITELDSFKNEKGARNSITGSSLEIDIMDDFLEMERLAALPEMETRTHVPESSTDANEFVNGDNPLKAELEAMNCKMIELEEKLKKIGTEKDELEKALIASQDSYEASQAQLKEVETRLEELEKELNAANESKELLEFQLISMEVEARTLSAKVDSLKDEAEKERNLAADMDIKCRELEDELSRKSQEIELHQVAISNSKPKINQEDLDVAADKLAECQKTIASLGRQLQSLATLEDFLIDTTNLPGFSIGTFVPNSDSGPPKFPVENPAPLVNGNEKKSPSSGPPLNGNVEKSPPSSSSTSSSSSNHVSSTKSRNGFGKLFSRSKSGVQLENQQA